MTRALPLGVPIRVIAGNESRLLRLSRRYGYSPAQAAEELVEEDLARARLVKTHFQRDVSDPLLYDAVWNTDAVPIPDIAKLVVRLADLRYQAWLKRRREKS